MEKKARNLIGIKENGTNPFKSGLLEEINIIARSSKILEKEEFVNPNDGSSIMHGVDRGERKFYWEDSRTFVKEFTTPYALEKTANLSYNGHRLLTLIKSKLEKNAENVRVSAKDFLDCIGKKYKEMYYGAVVELIEREIIALISDGVYYVNPRVIFNGKVDGLLPDAYEGYVQRFKENSQPHKSFK